MQYTKLDLMASYIGSSFIYTRVLCVDTFDLKTFQ